MRSNYVFKHLRGHAERRLYFVNSVRPIMIWGIAQRHQGKKSVSLLAIPEWKLHPHIFQEAPVAHAITNLQLDSTITSVAPTYLIYVYPQYVSMRAAIVAI